MLKAVSGLTGSPTFFFEQKDHNLLGKTETLHVPQHAFRLNFLQGTALNIETA